MCGRIHGKNGAIHVFHRLDNEVQILLPSGAAEAHNGATAGHVAKSGAIQDLC